MCLYQYLPGSVNGSEFESPFWNIKKCEYYLVDAIKLVERIAGRFTTLTLQVGKSATCLDIFH
jgi:hypothetical protein